jgi:two-component system NtrC family sensor kinase
MILEASHVRRALDTGQFAPFFQPLVVLRTGKTAGFEVLARWNHPDFGMITPSIFIPLAERDGWIDELIWEIVRQAFRSAVAIPAPLTLSVNISTVQLGHPNLSLSLQTAAAETGFPLDRVIVEITESAVVENVAEALATAESLKALGCRIALDDFGTGYSSLRHLQSLPFDEIKVDQSFVSSMTGKRESRKIAAAIIGLGQSLGLTTVAEGVESQEQADMLLWLGCDLGQGSFYGLPMPAQDLNIINPRRNAKSSFRWASLSAGHLEGTPAQRLAQLQAVYDGAPVGLGFLDRQLKYLNLNQQLAEIHGIPVEDHLGRNISEIIPDLSPQIAPFLERALQGERVADVEIRRPGTGKTFVASYQPARDEGGEVVGVSCAITDFTVRKKAEEKLRQFERLVDGLEEMIVVVDREYRYVLANRTFLKRRGLEEHQLVGRLVSELLDRKVFEDTVKVRLDECFTGKPVHYELRYNYPDIGPRDLEISYAPVDLSGGVIAAACILRDVTEMRRMERAESGWHKRIELAQKGGLRIGLWDWDLNTNSVIWSDESYRQFGYTRETFFGRVEDAVYRIHVDDRPRVELAIGKVLAGESKEFAEQYRIVRPDGSICWVDAHGVILRDDGVHMMGVGVDITGLKSIQQSLQESQDNYLLLLNSTAEAIYGLDPEGNCTFCNPACLRALGFESAETLLGRNMHSLIHHTRADGTSYPVEECPIFVAVREGLPTHLTEEVLWRSDGTSFPVEYWSYPMFKGARRVGAVVTFLDITERRRAEEERRRSDAQYRELFENATYGIFRSLEDGTLVDVNPALIEMLGYDSKDDLLARDLNRDIYEDPGVRAGILRQVVASGRVDLSDVNWRRKDGQIIHVHLSGRLRPGEDGSQAVMEVMAENITERRHLEEQFHQAQKMEAVGQLAGGVAHDFNNLLTVINGYSDMLLDQLNPADPARKLVQQVKDAGLRSAALTKQLLLFSRKQILAPQPVDLNTVAAHAESMLVRIIGEDIDLKTQLSPETCVVRADPGRIEQVILNLVVNARDAMPNGGQLLIRTERIDRNEFKSPMVHLEVSDTGTGMTPEVKSHLFEPFYTTKGPDRGTGLGLAVVHGIVKDCDGYIEVETQLGAGTTFHLYFPRLEEAELPRSARQHTELHRGHETILLVEDNEAVRGLMRLVLKDQGYVVLEAVDGSDALRTAQNYRQRIHLLATDVVMPGLGGPGLAEQLHILHPESRVLYLSGYARGAVEERLGIGGGRAFFLEKPFGPQALLVKIREVLELPD